MNVKERDRDGERWRERENESQGDLAGILLLYSASLFVCAYRIVLYVGLCRSEPLHLVGSD